MIASAFITPSARRHIEETFESNRQVGLIDLDRPIDLLGQYQLHQYVLFPHRPEPCKMLDVKNAAEKTPSKAKTAVECFAKTSRSEPDARMLNRDTQFKCHLK